MGVSLAFATFCVLLLFVTLTGLQSSFLLSGLFFAGVGFAAIVLFFRGYRWGKLDQSYFFALALPCVCVAIGLLGSLIE